MVPWILIGYAIGSVPFAFLVARRAGIDVRVAGSGNVGAANVLRTTGMPLGVTVLALDITKGAATVLAAYAAAGTMPSMAAAGAAAVVGHIYPVWLRFHGGKGVAVAAGAFAVLAPLATVCATAVFFSTVWVTRVISLGSVAATVTLPLAAWLAGAPTSVVAAAIGIALLILFRHRANVRRIVGGTEWRMGGAEVSERIAVLGAGSWGTALAVHCARIGHEVRLWGRDAALMDEIARTRENPLYLPGVSLDSRIEPTASLEQALAGAPLIVAAVPSHGMRHVLRDAAPLIRADAVLVSATKGLETETLARMSQVVAAETGIDRAIAVLSGPSFAWEVARGLPTAVVVASSSAEATGRVQDTLKGPALRLYASDDVTGVEFGGALKNVIAIAAGVVEGLGIGHNAMAALITRGLVEMSRLACAEGSRRETLAGLSGLGDLVLTCTGDLSRNRRVGIELGRGRSLEEILSETRMVAEGVRTTQAALALGAQHGVELPLAAQMAAVLEGRTTALSAVEALMLRPQRSETDRV